MPAKEPGPSEYLQRVSRKLLAIEGPPFTAQSAAAAAQEIPSRVGTAYWRWERAVHAFMTRHEAATQRFLAALPGLLAWSIILIPLLLSWDFPAIPMLVAMVYQVYWVSRGLRMLVYGTIGLVRVRAHRRIDWRATYEAERAQGRPVLPWDAIRHIVIIANYREPMAKLRQTLEALARQRDVTSQMWVILAMEGSEEGAVEKARTLQREFRGRLGALHYTLHPAGLPGEIAGKAANEAWAARWARQYFVGRRGHNQRYITVTSCDADSVFDPSYFACLTYKFATDPRRYLRFWQAPMLFHNNVWRLPTFIAFLTRMMGAGHLAMLTDPTNHPFPLSTYSTSLALLEKVGYWAPDEISEDQHVFLQCFFARRGWVTVETIYLPTSADGPLSPTLWRTAVNRYEQAKRHAWGATDVGYCIRMCFQHAEIPAYVKLPRLWVLLREHLIWSTSWPIITFGTLLPSLLNPGFVAWGPGLAFQKLFALMGIVGTVLGPFLPLIDLLLGPPRPAGRRWWQDVWACLQWPLLPVIVLLFFALPGLDAQTRMLLGEKLRYRVTEKA